MKIKIAPAAVIYCRVSTEEQARDAYGMESQETACRAFCDQKCWRVTQVFRDAGVSGWQDVQRPAFTAMMSHVRKSRNVNVVFYDYSRFGRNTLKALTAFEQLDEWGVFTVAANNPGIDCRRAAGRTARRDELSRAEDSSDQHSEKQQERMKAAFEDGRWGRQPPLGYATIGTKDKTRSNLVPDEREARYVRKAFELVALGHNRPAAILHQLTDEGLRSKQGNRLTQHTFLKMLRNSVYIGYMESKKHKMTVKGRHQAIVDERTFKNVQLVLNGKKPISAPYQRNREGFPLRRFLLCAACGTPMTGAASKSETGKRHPYYRCRDCSPAKSIPTAKADGEFVELLATLQPSHVFTTEFLTILREEWKKITGTAAALKPNLEKQLKAVRSSQENLVLKFASRELPIDRNLFERMNEKFEQEIAELEGRIADIGTEKATIEQLIAFCKSVLVDIAAAWETANLDQKQRVQNALFPRGLKYDPQKGILNSDNDCLFNQLESFVSGKLTLVRPERFELPT